MRLQIMEFSCIENNDSWITDTPIYPINLGARRKWVEFSELLVLYNTVNFCIIEYINVH